MTDDERKKKESFERVGGLAKSAAGSAVALGLGAIAAPIAPVAVVAAGAVALTNWGIQLWNDSRKRRASEFFTHLLSGDVPMTEEGCKAAMEDEASCLETLLRLLEDDEDEKSWAYAGLFRAFASGVVPEIHRLRFIRSIRELSNLELLEMRGWHKSSLAYVSGPFVEFRITFGPQYREWFVQPEVMLEEHPHVIESLVRWGFIRHVHERREQERASGIGGMTDTTIGKHPIPGTGRLQVEPMLALLLFVVAQVAQKRDLDLGNPKSFSVHEEGRVDLANYKCDRTLVLDGSAPDGLPLVENARWTTNGVTQTRESRSNDRMNPLPRVPFPARTKRPPRAEQRSNEEKKDLRKDVRGQGLDDKE